MNTSLYKKITTITVSAFLITGLLTSCGPSGNNQASNNKSPEPTTKVSDNATPKPVESTPTPEPKTVEHVPKPDKVRAIYYTGWSAGSDKKIQQLIDLTKTTELNSVVIDIKDDDGKVGYETSIKEVRAIKAWEKKYDVDKVIKKLHENNIYVIGRLVCFKDPILAQKRPDYAYKRKDGSIWRDNKGRAWINPLNKDTWDYTINIAKEAVDKGFDEIQYDYVRFSNDGNFREIYFGPKFDHNSKSVAISEFLRKSMTEINDGKGVLLSADVFGIAAVATGDDKIIGQNWEMLAKEVHFLSPMVYPSHYANTLQNGVGQEINGVLFKKPDLEPYKVVYNTLISGKKRLEKANIKTGIRPYLQAFDAPWIGSGYWQTYGGQQVRQQIKAVYDAGYDEWILWDPSNTYPEGSFLKK